MCGIAGGFALNPKGREYLNKINNSISSITHRGPDGEGIFLDETVALGHCRLSIIDVSCAADQPMHTSDGNFTIVFNGEIFNFAELRAQYLHGQQLRSNSDTEIFLLLYSRLKEKTFSLLRGFFAAVIYDHKEKSLILVRDRYGKKPLLYFQDQDKLLFASEMKALFAAGIPKQINWDLLPVYFQLNYIPQPYSMVNGVCKLAPGHSLKISHSGIEEKAYYEIHVHSERYNTIGYEDGKKQLVALMDEAVQMRMISDVPLGAFLSGGIDSSVVVALASQHTDHLRTFSIGYKDHPFFDETAFANLVSKKFNTDHTVFSLGNNDFLEHVNSVLHHIDEPFADSSAIPEFILSYYTRKHVTVALSGDGGDEVFAGYNKHAAEFRMRSSGIANNLIKMGHPLWSILPKSRNNNVTNIFRQLHRFSEGGRLAPAQRYWRWATFMDNLTARNLFTTATAQRINSKVAHAIEQEFTRSIKTADFNEVLISDMNLVLLSDMLVKVDLMSMANSLEIRSPFLDQEVVEFAFGLPTEYKIDRHLKKKIVQDAFRDKLPPELYNRPKKGFEIPLLDWFRKELWGLINDDLLQDNFVREQEIFNVHVIKQLKKQLHTSNPGDAHATVWALIVFQHWWKKYIAN